MTKRCIEIEFSSEWIRKPPRRVKRKWKITVQRGWNSCQNSDASFAVSDFFLRCKPLYNGNRKWPTTSNRIFQTMNFCSCLDAMKVACYKLEKAVLPPAISNVNSRATTTGNQTSRGAQWLPHNDHHEKPQQTGSNYFSKYTCISKASQHTKSLHIQRFFRAEPYDSVLHIEPELLTNVL